jgi:hypothetical protein
MATRLTQVISLLYSMQGADVAGLTDDLLERRKVAWSTALREQARTHRCSGQPNAPRGKDLSELKAMSAEDAKSISETWNREVQAQIEKIYAENPRANRFTYAKRLEAWAAERNVWKAPLIALTTEQQVRGYAQSRFNAMNGLRGQRYVFAGPTPTCRRCVTLFGLGIVSQSVVDRHVLPIHPGCPHSWRPIAPEALDCREIWLG